MVALFKFHKYGINSDSVSAPSRQGRHQDFIRSADTLVAYHRGNLLRPGGPGGSEGDDPDHISDVCMRRSCIPLAGSLPQLTLVAHAKSGRSLGGTGRIAFYRAERPDLMILDGLANITEELADNGRAAKELEQRHQDRDPNGRANDPA